MDRETALLILDNLIGVHSGNQCNIPNNPNSHSLFKTLARERGGIIYNEFIEVEMFTQILRDCADALTKISKEKEK